MFCSSYSPLQRGGEPRAAREGVCSITQTTLMQRSPWKGGECWLRALDSFDFAGFAGFRIDIDKHAVQLSVLRSGFEFFRDGCEEPADDIFLHDADHRIERARHSDVGLKSRAARKDALIRSRNVRMRSDDCG